MTGVSDGPDRGMGLGMRESADVVSALDFLEARGFERFAALGSSQGATSSILAAAIDSRIAAVVAQGTGTTLYEMMRSNAALAAFPDWWVRLFEQTVLWRTGPPWHEVVDNGPNPGDVIDRIAPRAVFLIHGEHDEMAPLAQARENFARAGEPKQLWVVPGARHRGLREAAGTRVRAARSRVPRAPRPAAVSGVDPRRCSPKKLNITPIPERCARRQVECPIP